MEATIASLVDQDLEIELEIVGDSSFSTAEDRVVIEARQEIKAAVAFAPRVVGDANASLRIRSCDGCAVRSILLLGGGLEGEVATRPSLLDFGGVAVGLTKTLSFSAENLGSIPVDLNLVLGENSSFLVSSSRYPTLDVGRALEISVTFAPAKHGVHAANLRIEDDFGWWLGGVSLVGEAIASLEAVPSSVRFTQPEGVVLRQIVEIRSLHPSREIRIIEFGLEGPDAEAFELEGPPSEATVGRDSQWFTIGYRAVGDELHEAELVIRTAESTPEVLRIPIRGEMVEGTCELLRSHDEVDFGLLPSDLFLERRIEFLNVGPDPCVIWEMGFGEADGCLASPSGACFRIVDGIESTLVLPGDVHVAYIETDVVSGGYDRAHPRTEFLYRQSGAPERLEQIEVRARADFSDMMRIQLAPTSPVEFPATPVGTESVRSISIRLITEGETMFVSSVRIGKDSSGAFRLVSPERELPAVVGEQWISFDVLFSPHLVERAFGQIEMDLSLMRTVRFDLAGTGIVGP